MSSPFRSIDVHHLGHSGEIAVWSTGDVLVDCGPTSSLPRLLDELGDSTPKTLLLTHIHLDHAGAAGSLVDRYPDLQVYVHPVGLPHLADPAKLLRSAERLYGDDMDRLWGEIKPVPEANLIPIADGDTIERFTAAHTPGHASHHVAFLHAESGCAFPGDSAGVRLGGRDLIMPHSPPPDIDLEGWMRSLDVLAGWGAESLCLPHFGAVTDVQAHLDRTRDAIREKAELARGAEQADFVSAIRGELSALDDEDLSQKYERTAPPDHMYLGLRRYWDKRNSS